MSEPTDLPPDPIVLHHYGEDAPSGGEPSPEAYASAQEDALELEALGAVNAMIAREAREIVRNPDPLVRAAAAYQLAPHEVPFLLGDPDACVRLAAARICAAFPLLRVLLWDLGLRRRDPSRDVRQAVTDLLATDASTVRTQIPTWATEAMFASELFAPKQDFESDRLPVSRVIPSIMPSGCARDRAASAVWARREILDYPAADFEPSPRDEPDTLRKTVARVHDANHQSWSPADALPLVGGYHDVERINHPTPHGPPTEGWDLAARLDAPTDPTSKETP